jgi:hypothetical protein
VKVSELDHGRLTTVELRRVDGDAFGRDLSSGTEVWLSVHEDGLWLHGRERRWPVEGTRAQDHEAAQRLAGGALVHVAWVVQVATTGQVVVQVHEFASALRWDEAIEIGIDERIVEDMRKRRKRLVSVESVVAWLDEHLLLHPRDLGGLARALLSGAPDKAFRLYGKGYAVDVVRDADERLLVTRVIEARRAVASDEHRPLHLVSARFRFCDLTVAASFRGRARTELDSLVAQADSYLGLWRRYNEIERKAILRRARAFGWIAYERARQLPDGAWRFDLRSTDESTSVRFGELDEYRDLQADVELPQELLGGDAKGTRNAQRGSETRPFIGQLVGRRPEPPSVDLRPAIEHEEREPPKAGFVFVALAGDRTRLRRREQAWDRIRSCANPMPQLGMLIEDQPIPERPSRQLPAITRATREVLLEPTGRQRLALEIALNTPDIALIQGPPGTGKTRVIAALQARLAERDVVCSSDGLAGVTLLTSFQHDAVENAAAATRVLGLPAVKIGKRRGSAEPADGVEQWARDTAQKARAARVAREVPDSVHAAHTKLRELAVAYLGAPSRREEPGHVLDRVAELAGSWLPGELAKELGEVRAALGRPGSVRLGDEDRAFALKAVRGLRTEVESFADDGPASAHRALRRLERLAGFELGTDERALLERAADWDPELVPSPTLLAESSAIKDRLIDRLQRSSEALTGPRAHADVERVLVAAVDALDARARERAPGAEQAVEEWIAALERDEAGIRAAVQHYSMVLAATCQQAVGPAMSSAKHDPSDIVFSTVVVDEAARANPLDLLIPMSLAERRIILVGDHRQLPHILEPEVERELEQSVEEQTRSALRDSLFERLFVELRKREADGIPRTVTLDMQYRMHPELGRFVSEQFYERHGEGFGSGRDAGQFGHDVSLGGVSVAGKVAVWIDLPHARGAESPGRSKRRPVEAKWVATEVADAVERHPELSVGVITFYRDQVEELYMAMEKRRLTERGDEGQSWSIREQWRRTRDGRERLRIGTVDAFQGKEFDVVFLSLTRSNRVPMKDEAGRRGRYGFLLLANRLCVAMSRQQRLLIVVGDPDMATGPDAELAVPALHAFRKLCEGEYGTIIRH